jgi:hypothetical protein
MLNYCWGEVPILNECFLKAGHLLVETGSGGEQAQYSVHLRLLKSLTDDSNQKWSCTGPEGLKNSTGPFSRTNVIEIINTAFSELHTGLGIVKLSATLINGTESSTEQRPVVIAGGSHARRIREALASKGHKTLYVETPHWRAVKQLVDAQIEDIRKALQENNMADAVIVLAMTDNAFFLARYEDGSEIGIRQAVDGSHHIDGILGYASTDKLKIVYSQLIPLFQSFPDNDKLLLMPLPRYLWKSCCSDPEHGPNILEDGHVVEQLAKIDVTFKFWRGMAFHDRISNLKLCNTSHLISDESHWAEDPVHPSSSDYCKVSGAIIKGINAMSSMRLSLLEDDLSVSTEAIKRQRDHDSAPSSPAHPSFTAKRPAWLTGNSNFASRSDFSWRGSRERGRGGRGGWGRGPFYSF